MGSFHESKRSDNKWYAVQVRLGIFYWEFNVVFNSLSGRKYSYPNSYNAATTVIAQDDHLTVGAWATCGPSELKAWEQVYRKDKMAAYGCEGNLSSLVF